MLARIAETGERGRVPCVAFGIDGVLCDSRPRTVAILGELAATLRETDPAVADALAGLRVSEVGPMLSATLRGCGLDDPARLRDASLFWHRRFYSDDYCDRDAEVPGAVSFVRACHEAGARVVYISTRDAPGMLLGTVSSLRGLGFPMAVPGVELALKPDGTMSDEAFHHGFVPALHRAGEVVAFFDHVAASCNLARDRFPAAEVALVECLAPPEQVAAAEGVRLVADLRHG